MMRLRGILDEAKRPLSDIGKVGVASVHKSAQEIEGRGRMAIGLDLPCRIGTARLRRELDAVDDIAAVARQLLALPLLRRSGARFCELAGNSADLHHRQGGGVGEHNGHLQEYAQVVADVIRADVIRAGLREAFGAIAAMQEETLAHADAAKRLLEVAGFAGKYQRRKRRELALDLFQRGLVRVLRHLHDLLLPPAVARPTLGHDRPPLRMRPAVPGMSEAKSGEHYRISRSLPSGGASRRPGGSCRLRCGRDFSALRAYTRDG